MCVNMILRKGMLALSDTHTDTQTHMNMNAGVALAQVEFWPSLVSSWGQANWYAKTKNKTNQSKSKVEGHSDLTPLKAEYLAPKSICLADKSVCQISL